MLRFSRNNDEIKFDEMNFVLLISKVATLKYIKINSTISVLEIFAYRQIILLILIINKLTIT